MEAVARSPAGISNCLIANCLMLTSIALRFQCDRPNNDQLYRQRHVQLYQVCIFLMCLKIPKYTKYCLCKNLSFTRVAYVKTSRSLLYKHFKTVQVKTNRFIAFNLSC